MNKFLANAIGRLNAVVAWFLIVVSPVVGLVTGGPAGLLVGLIVGLILALVVCGLLALLIDIRDSLREIADK